MRFHLFTTSTPEATLGYFRFPFDFRDCAGLFTIEKPWHNNRPFDSCFPGGFYAMEPYSSAKYPDTWAFVGEHVSLDEEPGVERYSCLAHIANWAKDVQGCVGFGMNMSNLTPDGASMPFPAVAASGNAMNILKDLLQDGDERHYCQVHRSFPAWHPERG